MKISLIGGEDNYSSGVKLSQLKFSYKKEFKDGSIKTISADEIDNIKQLGELNGEVGLFSSSSLLIIKNLIDSGKKSLKDDFSDFLKSKPEDSNLNIILFETSKFDKRSKIYKHFKKTGELIDYPAAKESEKKQFIKVWFKKNKYSISGSAIEILLAKLTPLSKLMINNELEKIRLLLVEDERNIITDSDLELINQDIEEEIWELFSLALINKPEAMKLLENLFNHRVHFSVIIGFLGSQLRQLIDFKFDQTSLSPFIRRKVSGIARKVSTAKLKKLVDDLVELDIELKSTKKNSELALFTYIAQV